MVKAVNEDGGTIALAAPVSNQEERTFDAFLSYSGANQEVVRQIYNDLTVKHGFHIWFDLNNISGSLGRAMAEGVNNSRVFIPVLSRDFQSSDNCLLELRYAKDRKKPMTPVRLLDPKEDPTGEAFATTAGLFKVDLLGIVYDSVEWNDRISLLATKIKFHMSPPPPMAAREFDAFLSYQLKSEEVATKIYEDLTAKHGLNVWFFLNNIGGSVNNLAAMTQGVHSSKVFIPVLNLAYQASENCMFEMRYAYELRKPMTPVRLMQQGEQAEGEAFAMTAGLLYADLAGKDFGLTEWNNQINILVKEIRRVSSVVAKTTQYAVMSPLHLASQEGNAAQVMLLLQHGVNVNTVNQEKSTPLHFASSKGYLDIVKLLVLKGANVNAENLKQETPLYLAAGNGHLEVVKFLRRQGSDLNAWNSDKPKPLYVATENGHMQVAQWLLEQRADVNFVNVQEIAAPSSLVELQTDVLNINIGTQKIPSAEKRAIIPRAEVHAVVGRRSSSGGLDSNQIIKELESIPMGMTLDQTIAHPLQTPLAGIDSDGDSLGYGSHESAPHSVTNSPLDYTGESAPSSSAPNSSNHRVAREVAEIRFDAMISYAWKDESKVRPIAESLQKMDFRIWLDVRNMGEDTIDSMIEGITQSAAVIAFISDDYVESHNCKKEIKYANEMRKPIIPVRLNDSPAVSISAAAFITAGQLYVDLKNGVTPKSHLEIADRLNRLSLSGLDAITISSDDVVVFDDDDDSFLGDGSVGTVSKGLYLNTTTVAVKTMKLRKLSTSAKDQLINEAKVLSRSRHPFVIGFQGLIKNKGVYSLVLEYATLGSLSEYYRDPAHKNTPLHERVPLLFQIASGMTYLHDTLGIVHNDLKSPNVLLTRLEPRGLVAKITDFGLSKIKDETRSATTNAKVDGSLLWMAPELRRIRPKVTQRNDVFSFAVLMTEVVSWIGVYGRPWGTHMIAVIDALRDEHQRQELLDELQTEVFRSSETTVGAALFGLFRRCWDFDWASRPRFRAVCLELTDLERRSLISRNA